MQPEQARILGTLTILGRNVATEPHVFSDSVLVLWKSAPPAVFAKVSLKPDQTVCPVRRFDRATLSRVQSRSDRTMISRHRKLRKRIAEPYRRRGVETRQNCEKHWPNGEFCPWPVSPSLTRFSSGFSDPVRAEFQPRVMGRSFVHDPIRSIMCVLILSDFSLPFVAKYCMEFSAYPQAKPAAK